MLHNSILTHLWVLFLLIVIVLPLAAYFGWNSGRKAHFSRRYDTDPPASYPGEASMGAILALLGLLLAFTFGYSLTRAEARKVTQLEEAAAIGTAFLRADHLSEPGRSALRTALHAYAGTRIVDESMLRVGGFEKFIERTTAAQALLWPTMIEALDEDTPPALIALVSNGITEVLDAHTRRLIAGTDYVPGIAKGMMLFCSAVALFFVGNNAGLRGRPLTWRTVIFAGVLSVVMLFILDFEKPLEGSIRLDTTVIKMTVDEMAASLADDSNTFNK